MLKDIAAHVGNNPLTKPVDEINARSTGDADDEPDEDQHCEVLINELAPFGTEAIVDHAPDS